MIVARSRPELVDALRRLRQNGGRLALVPTMGFLHEGHLSLIDLAREAADHVVVSIFVNPLQFGPGEDLERYPRDEPRDLKLLEARGVALAFAPSVEAMYPEGEPLVTVDPGPLGERLCGLHRPGHFRGVLTVVARLFGLVRPDVAAFGRKDFQQAVLIRRMVTDLEMGVEVLVGDVVREEDGLAMSSRNGYLTPDERGQAAGLFRALRALETCYRSGRRSLPELRAAFEGTLAAYPLLRLQYLDVVDPERAGTVDPAVPGAVAAAAVHVGPTRLIDNVVLGGESGG